MKNKKVMLSQIKVETLKSISKSKRYRVKLSEIKVVDRGCDGFC